MNIKTIVISATISLLLIFVIGGISAYVGPCESDGQHEQCLGDGEDDIKICMADESGIDPVDFDCSRPSMRHYSDFGGECGYSVLMCDGKEVYEWICNCW